MCVLQNFLFARTLQKVRGNTKLFGGLCVVFSGDWRQILPIIQGGSEAQIVNACLKYSPIWSSVAVHHLVDNMRVRLSGSTEVEEHSKWLLKVGLGSRVDLLKNTLRWVKVAWVRERSPSQRA